MAINVRVGIHRGLVYLDTDQDDVYGFAANLTARLSGSAKPGMVAVSDSGRTVGAWLVHTQGHVRRFAARGVDASPTITRCSASDQKHRRCNRHPLSGAMVSCSGLRHSWQRGARLAARPALGAGFLGGEPGIGNTWLATEAADVSRGVRRAP